MLELKIAGADEIGAELQKLPKRLQGEAAMSSLVRATAPLVSAVKALATSRTGALKKSIGFRLRRYRSGKVLFVAIGPRRGVFGPDGEQPSKYAHLIERGHYTKGDKKWVAAQPFMRPAWLTGGRAVLDRFNQLFGKSIIAELAKRKNKRVKK